MHYIWRSSISRSTVNPFFFHLLKIRTWRKADVPKRNNPHLCEHATKGHHDLPPTPFETPVSIALPAVRRLVVVQLCIKQEHQPLEHPLVVKHWTWPLMELLMVKSCSFEFHLLLVVLQIQTFATSTILESQVCSCMHHSREPQSATSCVTKYWTMHPIAREGFTANLPQTVQS